MVESGMGLHIATQIQRHTQAETYLIWAYTRTDSISVLRRWDVVKL